MFGPELPFLFAYCLRHSVHALYRFFLIENHCTSIEGQTPQYTIYPGCPTIDVLVTGSWTTSTILAQVRIRLPISPFLRQIFHKLQSVEVIFFA